MKSKLCGKNEDKRIGTENIKDIRYTDTKDNNTVPGV